MHNNINLKSRWEGVVALLMTLPTFVFAYIGCSLSFFYSRGEMWKVIDGTLYLALLSAYIFFALQIITTQRPTRLLVLRSALRTALLIGLLLGASEWWNPLQDPWLSLNILLMFTIPMEILTNPGYIFANDFSHVPIVLLTCICLFFYAKLGYQLMRRTDKISSSLIGSLLAGLCVPISLTLLSSVVEHLPLIMQPTELPLHEKLTSYSTDLYSNALVIPSQIILALTAGAVGMGIRSIKSARNRDRVTE